MKAFGKEEAGSTAEYKLLRDKMDTVCNFYSYFAEEWELKKNHAHIPFVGIGSSPPPRPPPAR